MKKVLLALAGLTLLAITACSPQPAVSSANAVAPAPAKERTNADVQAALAAQRGGPLINEKFLLQKSAWQCTQNCPGPMLMRFLPSSSADLGASVTKNGSTSHVPTYLFPGYRFVIDVEHNNWPCRFITDDVLQCDVMTNVATEATDHLFFKRQ